MDEQSPQYWKNTGNDFFKKGQYEDAIKCYVKAIELNPDFFEAWNNLGLSLMKVGKTEEAQLCNKKVKELKQKSNNIEILKRKYEDGLITYDQYKSGISQPIEKAEPQNKPKKSNENLKWALIVSIPFGIIATIGSGIPITHTADFFGSIVGAMLIPFIVVFLLLEFVINRPKK